MTRPYLILKRYNLINKLSFSKSGYKLENITSKHCPKCNELLFNEKSGYNLKCGDIDYPYVCLYCDENFYNIELRENGNKSDVDLLMERVRANK
jgi:uncharacterized Zn finger protein (UPF0148 family)